MRLQPARWLPVPNVERVHSGSGKFRHAALANAFSTFSRSLVVGKSSISGIITRLNFLFSRATFTSQVSSSSCSIVTAELGGHSGGITNRRRSSSIADFICGNIQRRTKNWKLQEHQFGLAIGLGSDSGRRFSGFQCVNQTFEYQATIRAAENSFTGPFGVWH
jgi:hypothetical protein